MSSLRLFSVHSCLTVLLLLLVCQFKCGPVLAFFSTVSLGFVMLRLGASTWLPKSQVLDVKRAQHLEKFPEVELQEWELESLLLSSSHSSLTL